jgi:hypothetical protein
VLKEAVFRTLTGMRTPLTVAMVVESTVKLHLRFICSCATEALASDNFDGL